MGWGAVVRQLCHVLPLCSSTFEATICAFLLYHLHVRASVTESEEYQPPTTQEKRELVHSFRLQWRHEGRWEWCQAASLPSLSWEILGGRHSSIVKGKFIRNSPGCLCHYPITSFTLNFMLICKRKLRNEYFFHSFFFFSYLTITLSST